MDDATRLALIRSIIGQAEIETGKNLSPAVTAAVAWRTIGHIKKLIGPDDDENKPANFVTV